MWVPTVFSKNRDRLLEGDIAEKFFAHVLAQARLANLLSDEYSASTEPSSKPGRVRRVFSGRIGWHRHQMIPVI